MNRKQAMEHEKFEESNTDPKTQTWTKLEPAYITCSSCGDRGHYPISREWWYEHTNAWHALKHRFKRIGRRLGL